MKNLTPEQRVWRVIEDWVEGYEMRACVTDFMQNQLVEQILTANTEPEDENRCPACGKFMAYGKMSDDVNEFGKFGYRCKCGYERLVNVANTAEDERMTDADRVKHWKATALWWMNKANTA